MTPEQLKKNPLKPIIKVHPNQELDIDEGESAKDEEESSTCTELSEDLISDIHTIYRGFKTSWNISNSNRTQQIHTSSS